MIPATRLRSPAVLVFLFASACGGGRSSSDGAVQIGDALETPRCSPGECPQADRRAVPLGGGKAHDAAADAPADAGSKHEAGDASAPAFWQETTTPPPFIPFAPLLLTDGTVMVHSVEDSSTWWRLTPDMKGSYVDGAWTELAPMPAGYEPLFFASAVLPSGHVIVVGGEYNRDEPIETALGAIYDPVADAWTPIDGPSSWDYIGDAPGVVLANGVFMVGSAATTNQALFDERTLTWTLTGAGKADYNAEEGWTLLPSGEVLTEDVVVSLDGGAKTSSASELYDPTTGRWHGAGSVGPKLADEGFEIGPSILMVNGTVFAMGATSHTALYGADGKWASGPDFPVIGGQRLDIADGPAVLLPNGHVLCAASPGNYQAPTHFLDFDGTTFTRAPQTPNAPEESSYSVNLLVLPTGQILNTDQSEVVEVYNPTGSPDPSWAPTITTAPTSAARGSTNPIVGTQFNGLSQAVSYGDDYQAATNYPLVRITNDATGHVFYARTHDHSSMGVATGTLLVSTLFDVASATETGKSHLVVVANGIASAPVALTIL